MPVILLIKESVTDVFLRSLQNVSENPFHLQLLMVGKSIDLKPSERVSVKVVQLGKEVVHLTFILHIFSAQVKSGARCIPGHWGRVQNKLK